jgi:hypothetical protein
MLLFYRTLCAETNLSGHRAAFRLKGGSSRPRHRQVNFFYSLNFSVEVYLDIVHVLTRALSRALVSRHRIYVLSQLYYSFFIAQSRRLPFHLPCLNSKHFRV